jgi:hypothetical protein
MPSLQVSQVLTRRASKPRARLTEDEVIQIFKLRLDSPRPASTKLATLYHVSEKTVRDIWKGRTWSRETWHLDTSRTLQVKQTGRPKGCRDRQPRKKCVSGMRGYETEWVHVHEPFEADSEDLSVWYRFDPSLSYNTFDLNSLSTRLDESMALSVDDQLHEWEAFWRSSRFEDPFGSDWTTRPFEKA